ncbi:LysR substrate-binding domain-containing protein [Chelativorans sp. Marseille-P2723]|uniref:LysR substrate-binding domain-containing protein n=1 Tax=Chelativorans sp. Marseille-P2723 TaxID=2709133 RepID=UPI00156F2297|nr:LysR substrate-binding domain-containing protein [Chelativorans sp. Marseille-P2723]
MNLDQLRIFVAVAEREHVTRAAEALGLSQSAASAAIKALEAASGVKLFNRVGRNVELSRAGARFLPEARAVLEQVATARQALESVAQTIAGSVSVAASQTIASYWLPRRLAAFHERHPAVRLDVSIGNTRQVEAAVLDGAADVGLVEGRTHADLLKRVALGTDRLMLVTAAGLGGIDALPEGEVNLSTLKWVVRESGSGTREVLEDLMAQQGGSIDDLSIFLVLPSNEAIIHAVEAGAGATIISELAAATALERRTVRILPFDIPPREFVLIVHRDRQPTLSQAAFKSFLVSGGKEEQPSR